MPYAATTAYYTKMNVLQVSLGASSAPLPTVAVTYCLLPSVVLPTCEPCKYKQLFIHFFSSADSGAMITYASLT